MKRLAKIAIAIVGIVAVLIQALFAFGSLGWRPFAGPFMFLIGISLVIVVYMILVRWLSLPPAEGD